jgi:zinc transporter ZupT
MTESRSGIRAGIGHPLVGVGIAVGCLMLWSGMARAHGGAEHSGAPVAFQVVLWAPVVTGFIGGIGGMLYRVRTQNHSPGHRVNHPLGLLLLVLGGTFAVSALIIHPVLGIGGVCLGAVATGWTARRDVPRLEGHGHHGDLTFGGICVHRVLEGVAIGAMYTVNSTIGAVGMVIVAGHAALETAAVGSSYSPLDGWGVAAISLIQIGYLAGTVVGLGGVSVPPSVHHATIGLLAGAFLAVGLAEIRQPSTTMGHGRVPE